MNKRTFYLKSGSLGTALVTFFGNQSVFANPPKAMVKDNSHDDQNELVDKCMQNVVKYWKIHVDEKTLKELKDLNSGSENDKKILQKRLNELTSAKDVDSLLKKLVSSKKLTLPELNKEFSEYYNLALKDTKHSADCRVMSCYVLDYLNTKDIEGYMMTFNDDEENSRDVIIYPVLEEDGEKWYVCDTEMASARTLIELLSGKTPENILNSNDIKNSFKIPLIDYVKERVKNDVTCRVYVKEMDKKQIVGDTGYTDEYWLLGEFINNRCKKDFQDKCLIKTLSQADIKKVNSKLEIFSPIGWNFFNFYNIMFSYKIADIFNARKLDNIPFRVLQRGEKLRADEIISDYQIIDVDKKIDSNGKYICYGIRENSASSNLYNCVFMPVFAAEV